MTDDIREKAEALVKEIDTCYGNIYGNMTAEKIRNWREYKDLKAALRPSRKEIATYLDAYEFEDDLGRYVKLAIEELRK